MRHPISGLCLISVALVALAVGATPARAQDASGPTPVMAMTLAPARDHARLDVRSSAFENGTAYPEQYTQFGANQSPPLSWNRGPAGTKSYVLLMEDSGVRRAEPIFHWVLYNVPADVTSLSADLPTTPELTTPAGAVNGLNIAHRSGYMGPRPPPGQTHPYHFEVFALDTTLSVKPDMADRNTIVDSMKGHVLAEGEIVGNYGHH